MRVHARLNKENGLNVKDSGKIKGFKSVKVKFKATDKKTVKISAKQGYTYEVTDAAAAKVKLTGNKNFTGFVTRTAEK